MATVRPFTAEDAVEVARLFRRIYPAERAMRDEVRAGYFRRMFFDNPWADPELPSWVACHDGRLVGFLGVLPRPMVYRGRRIRAAILSQLMVAPDKRHVQAAAKLLRTAGTGPQDLTLSDAANDSSRRLSEACGGVTSSFYSLHWQALLRPAHWIAEQAVGPRAAALLAAPLALLDGYAARRRTRQDGPALREEPLTAEGLRTAMETLSTGVALRPHYEPRALEWLLGEAQAKRRHGELQARLLRRADGQIAGWFLYYLHPRLSRVVQLGARKGCEGAVLAHLFRHAWKRRTAALEGRMARGFAPALAQHRCQFTAPGVYVLFHSRHPQIADAVAYGNAFLSRLDGEWWMRFFGEASAAASDAALAPASEIGVRARSAVRALTPIS